MMIINKYKNKIILIGSIIGFLLISICYAYYIIPSKNEYLNKELTEAIVYRVIDGDTVELSNGEKVRYLGIDTPEVRKKQGDNWMYMPEPFSEEASSFNKKILEGKKVRLEYDTQRRDKYNRLLAYVFIDDIFVNGELVKEGYARVYSIPPNIKYTERLSYLQTIAKENHKGIWSLKGR